MKRYLTIKELPLNNETDYQAREAQALKAIAALTPVSRWRLTVPAALIVAGCGALLFVEEGGPYNYLKTGFIWGTIFAHASLAAAWTAFGPGWFLVRLPLALVWLTCATFAITYQEPPGFRLILACCAFAPWILLQLPFWSLVFGYRLRLRQSDLALGAASRLQFGILQFMIFTAIVCMLLAVGRISFQWLPGLHGPGELWQTVIFLVAAAMTMTLPLLVATLLPRHALPAVVGALLLIALVTIVELPLFLQMTKGGPGGPNHWHFISINAFTAGWILLIAGLMRWTGYRLRPAA